MDQLYVLECTNDKYYVGKTKDVIRRFDEHKSGKGSAWTSKYRPVKILECRTITNDHDENNVTKDYMKKYGIENVRGGSYTQIMLPPDVISVLHREFGGTMNLCYKCNMAGHFGTKCPYMEENTKSECWGCSYCDRTFTTKFGCAIHEKKCSENDELLEINESKGSKESKGKCYKCGRAGHYSPACYAKTHVKGYYLD
jgi:cellular nucleic acid-binding protein